MIPSASSCLVAAAPFLAQQAVVSALNPPRPVLLDGRTRLLLGSVLLVGSILFLVIGLYCVLFSSYLSYNSEYVLLRTIARDEYYKYLVPLLIPAGLVFVIINWGGLHYFRHA